MGLALVSFGTSPTFAKGGPILVELFTSQGCSSCPPAEDWLNGTGMKLFQEGKVIPLAFHVDYWDYLGWKDTFSSSGNTHRQRRYAAFWQSRSIYTPQMVVQGRAGFVGSDGDQAQKEIAKAGKKTGEFPFTWKVQGVPGGLQLDLHGTPPEGVEAVAALFQNGCVTKVGRGENAGRTLIENFVVRQWGPVPRDHEGKYQARFQVPEGADLKDLGLAVFLQDPMDLGVSSAHCLFPLSIKRS